MRYSNIELLSGILDVLKNWLRVIFPKKPFDGGKATKGAAHACQNAIARFSSDSKPFNLSRISNIYLRKMAYLIMNLVSHKERDFGAHAIENHKD